jgi:outer membrane protein assembly factor BamB
VNHLFRTATFLFVCASTAGVAAQTFRPERPLTVVAGTPAGVARMDRIDASRSGMSRTPLPARGLHVDWRTTVEAVFDHGPVVDARGGVYLVTSRGDVVAIGPDGAEKWRTPTGGSGPGPAALLSDDTVVFVDSSGDAFGVREARLRWRVHAGKSDGGRPAPLPLADGGLVAAAGRDLVAFDGEGRERGRALLPEAVSGSLLSASGRVVAVTVSGTVWTWQPGALDATRVAGFGSPVEGGAAAGDDHTLLAVTGAGLRLSAVDLREGAATTRATSAGALWLGPPAVVAGVSYLLVSTPSGELALALDASGREVASALLRARSPVTGADGGVALAPAAYAPPLVDAAGTVVVATASGAVGSVPRLGRGQGSAARGPIAPESIEWVASACVGVPNAVGQGVIVAAVGSVAGLAPLSPARHPSVVVACRRGDVVAISGTAEVIGDGAGQAL